jgi:hypothetical protein
LRHHRRAHESECPARVEQTHRTVEFAQSVFEFLPSKLKSAGHDPVLSVLLKNIILKKQIVKRLTRASSRQYAVVPCGDSASAATGG